MQAVKRVEIVIDELVVPEVLRMLEAEGVTGWTLLRDVRGKGSRGERAADDVTAVATNALVLVACTPEQAKRIGERLRPLLKRQGGLMLASDALSLLH